MSRCPSRARPAAPARPRVRRLPHRPAPARRRGRGRAPAADPRPPDRRRRDASDGRRGRRAVARLDRRRVRLLPRGPREPVPTRASPAATSTAATPSTRSPTSGSASPLPDGHGRRAGRAAAVRRADRPPRAAARGRRQAARALRVRRGGAHHLPGRRARGPPGVRVHARRRRRTRRRSRVSLGAEWAGDAMAPARSRSTRRSSSPPRASSSPRRCARRRRAASSCAPGST